MQDLILELKQARNQLAECITAYKHVGRQLAESERKYRVALRQEILRLKVDGPEEKDAGPVAWTVCGDIARGEEIVAKLRLERDIRKSDYDVCYEKILQLKTEIRLLEGELAAMRRGE